MKVTRKEVSAFNAMLGDKWAPSANENYNQARYGMQSPRFYEMKRHIESAFGMRYFWPSKITMKHFEA